MHMNLNFVMCLCGLHITTSPHQCQAKPHGGLIICQRFDFSTELTIAIETEVKMNYL